MSIEPDANCTEKHYSKCKKGPEPPKKPRLRRPDLLVVPHPDALCAQCRRNFSIKNFTQYIRVNITQFALYLFVT